MLCFVVLNLLGQGEGLEDSFGGNGDAVLLGGDVSGQIQGLGLRPPLGFVHAADAPCHRMSPSAGITARSTTAITAERRLIPVEPFSMRTSGG